MHCIVVSQSVRQFKAIDHPVEDHHGEIELHIVFADPDLPVLQNPRLLVDLHYRLRNRINYVQARLENALEATPLL